MYLRFEERDSNFRIVPWLAHNHYATITVSSENSFSKQLKRLARPDGITPGTPAYANLAV